jgi:hypothetical protein
VLAAVEIGAGAELTDRTLEAAYRHARIDDGRPWGTLLPGVMAVSMAVFAGSDHALYGLGTTFWSLLTARVAFVLGSMGAMTIVRQTHSPWVLERCLVMWWGALVAVVTVINLTRPASYTANIAIDVLVVFTAYVALPVRWTWRVLAAVGMTAATLATLVLTREFPGPLARNLALVAYGYANGIGAAYAWVSQVADRRRFVAFEHGRGE